MGSLDVGRRLRRKERNVKGTSSSGISIKKKSETVRDLFLSILSKRRNLVENVPFSLFAIITEWSSWAPYFFFSGVHPWYTWLALLVKSPRPLSTERPCTTWHDNPLEGQNRRSRQLQVVLETPGPSFFILLLRNTFCQIQHGILSVVYELRQTPQIGCATLATLSHISSMSHSPESILGFFGRSTVVRRGIWSRLG